jgi:hypothetical protein
LGRVADQGPGDAGLGCRSAAAKSCAGLANRSYAASTTRVARLTALVAWVSL